MRWSKLKARVEARFAASIRDRVSIYSTAYGNCTCGHAWITIEKQVVANFCTRAFYNTNPVFDRAKRRYVHGPIPQGQDGKPGFRYAAYGELSRQDAYQACWEFVHDLTISEALTSTDPLIQTLAVLDERTGRRRLRKLNVDDLHPLAAKMLEERLRGAGDGHAV